MPFRKLYSDSLYKKPQFNRLWFRSSRLTIVTEGVCVHVVNARVAENAQMHTLQMQCLLRRKTWPSYQLVAGRIPSPRIGAARLSPCRLLQTLSMQICAHKFMHKRNENKN